MEKEVTKMTMGEAIKAKYDKMIEDNKRLTEAGEKSKQNFTRRHKKILEDK